MPFGKDEFKILSLRVVSNRKPRAEAFCYHLNLSNFLYHFPQSYAESGMNPELETLTKPFFHTYILLSEKELLRHSHKVHRSKFTSQIYTSFSISHYSACWGHLLYKKGLSVTLLFTPP